MADDGGNKNSSGGSRQTTSRWTPTPEQIRILKDLYYNNGVRSPTADQIQRISAKLRQYGKIEGKNVFYWFQNHKARERHKKRFPTANHHLRPPPPLSPPTFAVEGRFREHQGLAWDSFSYPFLDPNLKFAMGMEEVEDRNTHDIEIETLPLFPINDEATKVSDFDHEQLVVHGGASLELSLNSCYGSEASYYPAFP